jgi:hypothetical protein
MNFISHVLIALSVVIIIYVFLGEMKFMGFVGCGLWLIGRDPDDKQIQKELLQLKRVKKEEERATAHLFKGWVGPPPKPKQHIGRQSSSNDDPAAAAAAGIDSSSRSSSNHLTVTSHQRGLLQGLFAAFAAVLCWLRQLLGIGSRRQSSSPVTNVQ